ncbi:MAG TPA: helix-turn-helix transcriptional regulator [Puia sp.]|jgi:AraC-like DNA-binding protein|nr:helix-turn-helix transcriptional regulator [Puia sp.]
MLLLKTIVLLGALQGFIVSILLWSSARRRPEERTTRRLLAAIILFCALACLGLYLDETAWENETTIGSLFNAVVPLIIIMPIGPLIYLYVRSLGEPGFRLERRYRPHFYPIVVDLFQHFFIGCFIAVAFIGSWLKLFHHNFGPAMRGLGVFLDDYNQYADIPRWISLTVYLVLATRYLRRQKVLGSAEWQRWPSIFLRVFWIFDVIWLIFLIPYELPRVGDMLLDKVDWYPLYLPLVAIIYFLGIKGYFITYRSETLPEPKKLLPLVLPAEKVGPVINALRQSMEADGLWLNPELNLTLLAKHCGVAPKTLSIVLNQHLGSSFTDYVNHYRIDAVKERIVRPESRQLTIAGLAYECGFNSLPTFQRAFKAITGMSPKEYLYRNMINSGFE